SIQALVFQLLIAPQGPLFKARRKEDFELRVREDDGAHVSAVGDEPWPARKCSLSLHEARPDPRHHSNAGGSGARLFAPNVLTDLHPLKPDALQAVRPGTESR